MPARFWTAALHGCPPGPDTPSALSDRRLELVPLDATSAGNSDIIEAQIPATEFRSEAYKDGEVLVLTPRKARVFVA